MVGGKNKIDKEMSGFVSIFQENQLESNSAIMERNY
jgi:hypothetical protein